MKTIVPIRIVTCPQWHARQPKQEPTWLKSRSAGIIIHHTAGHHVELAGPGSESDAEAMRYARDVQAYHMDHNGWIDSGHNFLVCRGGQILQGRWRTVSAIEQGLMVVSAHCPGFNDWIGIEHEHKGTEVMTHEQRLASAQLQAWIAGQYGLKLVLPADPHSAHFATECPANIKGEIGLMRDLAQSILNDTRKAAGV